MADTGMKRAIEKGLMSLGYDKFGPINTEDVIKAGDLNQHFIQLVCWLVTNLKPELSGEADTFPLELIGLLRDLGCPYVNIIGGKGLQTEKGKMFTLDYLITEVQVARMCSNKNEKDGNDESMDVDSSAVSNPLINIMKTLDVPLNTTVTALFQDIEKKLQERLKSLPSDHFKEPLLKKPLNKEQWNKVSAINDALCQDYKQRREVLIKRVDVTVQSFCWSEKLKASPEKVVNAFQPIRAKLQSDSITSVVDILAARTDLYPIEKTSSGESREATKCHLNKILIPKVPDRGGRPSKQAPPQEMPKFMKRQADPPRGGGRGRGRGRGGRGGGARGGSHNKDGDSNKDKRQFERGSGGERGWRGKQGRGGGRGGFDDYQRPPSSDNKMYYS